MAQTFEQRLTLLGKDGIARQLADIHRGIEKESLRISADGRLAQSPHPSCLGSTLTNSYITTDYSEALLEFITPPHQSVEALLDELDEIHRFTYRCLDQELLWTASMPCILQGDEHIPLARYGSSNIGQMKTIYRRGLGLRYGRPMQTIAGIHYNFSLSDKFWQKFANGLGDHSSLQEFKNDQYLGMIRNFRRLAWLLIYLFGASPSLCKSFVGDVEHGLQSFDKSSLYLPDATALRMGKLGYQSSAQEDILVSYNSLDSYMSTLHALLTREVDDYATLGTRSGDGKWQQLSTSMLQIENEFYSTIRPKQPVLSGEAPLSALQARGIEYIEVRALDVNPYLPLGIDAEQIHFLDAFLLYCLVQPSPPLCDKEYDETQANLGAVVDHGRRDGLSLQRDGQAISMKDWAQEVTSDMADICSLLDKVNGDDKSSSALAFQQEKLANQKLTPSAQILADMRAEDVPFFHFAMDQSQQHADYFLRRPLPEDRQQYYHQCAVESIDQQTAIEKADSLSFEEYLANYYRQYEEFSV